MAAADPYGPSAGINAESLRPGVDHVSVCQDGHSRKWGAKGLYMGHGNGSAIVDFGDGPEAFSPAALTEASRIECGAIDPHEFDLGYSDGANACWDDVVTGSKSKQQKPTAYSRGFLKGFEDAKADRVRPFSLAPYNETVRHLGSLFPDEYPEGATPRDHEEEFKAWLEANFEGSDAQANGLTIPQLLRDNLCYAEFLAATGRTR